MGATPLKRPRRVEALAFAKLNLHLEILGRRPDGYHELVSLFQSVDLADRLTLVPSAYLRICVTPPGLQLGRHNLVRRALDLLRERYSVRTGARVRLLKKIPSGAGLGGGSSDAAAALVAGSALWGIRPTPAELRSMALELGSDVPFFLRGGAAWMGGRGEKTLGRGRLPDFVAVLAKPGFAIPTAQAFSSLKIPLTRGWGESSLLDYSFDSDAAPGMVVGGKNAFESRLARLYPGLLELKKLLRMGGARGVRMTGSGSAMFGIARNEVMARELSKSIRARGFGSWVVRPTERGMVVIVSS